jgi:CheY-like chemotaxis protein
LRSGDLQDEADLRPGTFVELAISDTGPGMDKQTINRIFEPYFTTKEIGKGSGIGLSVVHGIVTCLGGIIKVKSKIGKGSTFRVLIPAAEKEKIAPAKEDGKAVLPTGTERILVVDDEPTIVDLAEQNLSRLGYTVSGHTSSVKALEDFRSRGSEIDLVITDMTMPNMTGIQLVIELSKIKKDIPIILCTGYSLLLPEENEAKKLGVRKILMKPVDRQEMAKSVREVLDEARTKGEG